ncbi:hypothetical protein L6164_020818 [Bauhinia variegata]|uniref:Uncharacterized protein n=1 Tax=Bauhinia variegata TaxID=167791 RepID=A0ACB9MWF7_BAUVA|nr:hypothetical protein L6164_020818 [Bauhinia variegata]
MSQNNHQSDWRWNLLLRPRSESNTQFRAPNSLEPTKSCLCGRRHLIQAATIATSLFLNRFSNATNSPSGYKLVSLFSNLRGKPKLWGKARKVLEIGIGAGPNLKYYATNSSIEVIGLDPNPKVEKYARFSAESAGLLLANFKFIHGVGEAIPLQDASVDAVVGTLVLCSVKDVKMTLEGQQTRGEKGAAIGGLYLFEERIAARDGTLLRYVQRVVDLDNCRWLASSINVDVFCSGYAPQLQQMKVKSKVADQSGTVVVGNDKNNSTQDQSC